MDFSQLLTAENIQKQLKRYAWLWLKWSWLVLILAAALGYYLYQSKAKLPSRYVARLSFSMNEGGGADQGYLQQVLGGGLFAGLGGSSELASGNMGRLQELLSTRRLLQMALFEEIEMIYPEGPKKDFMIHHYLELQAMRKQWAKEESSLADLYFQHKNFEEFSRQENVILQAVVGRIQQQLTQELSPSEILNIRFVSNSEVLSHDFINLLYNKLNTYYSNQSVEKQRRIFEAARSRRDSLEQEMDQAEEDYIKYLNQHNATAQGRYAESIRTQYLARKLSGEMEGYFLAIKNVETAKLALEQQTPLLQVIDRPLYPLYAERPNPRLFLFIGLFLGFFLGTSIVLGIQASKDILKFLKAQQAAKKEHPTEDDA